MQDTLRRFKAELFQALAHPTRVALVEALAQGEQPAGKLIEQLGLEQANASQHLAILRAKHVVTTRRAGNQIYYALRDPVLANILALLRDYFFAHLSESVSMFDEMKQPLVIK
jgi:DNA-binding transcriptional ArsR family regulator